jgi:hypothetical protein
VACYYFFSNEGQPPETPHIHVKGGGRDAKVWLEPEISLDDSYGLNPRELSNICGLSRKTAIFF